MIEWGHNKNIGDTIFVGMASEYPALEFCLYVGEKYKSRFSSWCKWKKMWDKFQQDSYSTKTYLDFLSWVTIFHALGKNWMLVYGERVVLILEYIEVYVDYK